MKNFGLLKWLAKRKLTDEKVANIFVNSTFETVEKGWPEVASLLNASPEFVIEPNLDPSDYGRFLMIVVAANLSLVPKHFEPGVDRAIIKRCCAKFGLALGVPKEDFALKVKQYRMFMKKANHPSNNVLTAMTRAVFYKYRLIEVQEPYFRDMNVPNPIIMKNLRDVMGTFMMGWDEISDNYRITTTDLSSVEDRVTSQTL
ncbi:MAG: hypothetical protein COA49_02220 [Bacteroidetes bacterium]|nr:MAG: hypothetical protein COA49_02220 [Bacteroidota bacterium]